MPTSRRLWPLQLLEHYALKVLQPCFHNDSLYTTSKICSSQIIIASDECFSNTYCQYSMQEVLSFIQATYQAILPRYEQDGMETKFSFNLLLSSLILPTQVNPNYAIILSYSVNQSTWFGYCKVHMNNIMVYNKRKFRIPLNTRQQIYGLIFLQSKTLWIDLQSKTLLKTITKHLETNMVQCKTLFF